MSKFRRRYRESIKKWNDGWRDVSHIYRRNHQS
jgi:hypothetical protein